MKILAIQKTYKGGVNVVMQNIQRELERMGHRIDIYTRNEDIGCDSALKSIFKIRNFVNKMDRKNNYDVIYTQDWSIALPLLVPWPIKKKKHFVCFHGLEMENDYLQRFVAKRMGTHVNVIGDSLKELYPKSTLIFNGCRNDLFKSMPNIKKIKNSVGFANWKNNIYHYKEIKEAVESAGKKFIVAEGIPYEKMPEFYNSLETFISLPPWHTSCALVWLEALLCGVPKIIGNSAGIRFPINFIEQFKNIKDAIINAKEVKQNFQPEKFTWKYHTEQLLKHWKNNGIN